MQPRPSAPALLANALLSNQNGGQPLHECPAANPRLLGDEHFYFWNYLLVFSVPLPPKARFLLKRDE